MDAQALTIHPDNLHCIDRLAVALMDNGDIAKGSQKGAQAAVARTKARAMLLHYAVLRRLVNHPLQRPMVLYRTGLATHTFWHPTPDASADGGSAAIGTHVGHPALDWLAFLEDPQVFEAIQRELLAVVDSLTSRTKGKGGQDRPTGGLGDLEGHEQREGIHVGGQWSEVHIIEEERVSGGAEETFPITLGHIRKAKFLNARISVLQAATHITPHCQSMVIPVTAYLPKRERACLRVCVRARVCVCACIMYVRPKACACTYGMCCCAMVWTCQQRLVCCA